VVKLATVITIVLQSGSLQSTSSTYTTFAFIERFLNAINDIPRVLKLFIIAQVSIRRLSDFLLQDDRVEAPASTRSGTGGRQGAPSLPQRPTPSPSLPPVSSDGYYLPDGRQGRGGPGEGGSDVDGFQSACEHDTEPEPEALRRMRPRGLTSSSASLVATESLPPADRVSLSNPSRLRSSSVYSQGERPDVSSAVEDVFYDVDEGHVTDAVQVPQTSRARTATTGDLDLTVGPLRTQRARPAKRHPVIDFRDASFSWRPPSRDASTGANTAGSLALREIRMRVMEGDLIVVLGPSGAGKSSLLASFLGEMNLAEGRASVTIRGHSGGGVGYAPQSPWIVAGTIRENIIFRRPFHPEAYEKIIDAVCLREDLAEFVAGDLTEIEGGGHSLSGGQRARISLARAVYAASLANEDQGTEISQQLFLIDDPFASLDATRSSSSPMESSGATTHRQLEEGPDATAPAFWLPTLSVHSSRTRQYRGSSYCALEGWLPLDASMSCKEGVLRRCSTISHDQARQLSKPFRVRWSGEEERKQWHDSRCSAIRAAHSERLLCRLCTSLCWRSEGNLSPGAQRQTTAGHQNQRRRSARRARGTPSWVCGF